MARERGGATRRWMRATAAVSCAAALAATWAAPGGAAPAAEAPEPEEPGAPPGVVSLDLVSPSTDLGSFGLALEWDMSTGAVTGQTTFEPLVTETTTQPPLPVLDVVATTHVAPIGDRNVSGSLDPVTGRGALVADHLLRTIIDIGPDLPQVICESAPFDVTLSNETAGVPLEPLPFDEDSDYAITMLISLPVPAYGPDDCTLNGVALPDVATTVNEGGGLPLLVEGPAPLTRGTPPPPPPPPPPSSPPAAESTTTTTTAPPTTTTTAPPTTAPDAAAAAPPTSSPSPEAEPSGAVAAQAVSSRPRFTG